MDTTSDPSPGLASEIAPDLEKPRLRRRLRAVRRRLALEWPHAAEDAAKAAPVELWAQSGVIAGYVAVGSEIDPAPLLARLAAAGARIVLPAANARHAPLVFRDAVAPADLVADVAGIPAPPQGTPVAIPGLVITPLLGFDRWGGRLGQGGGYYDRTLAALRARGAVIAVGLGFSGQAVERIPVGPLDQRLDAILTERGYRPV